MQRSELNKRPWTSRFTDLDDEELGKAMFAMTELFHLLHEATGGEVRDARYFRNAKTGDEVVSVEFPERSLVVNVSCDSKLAMALDVLKAVCEQV